jgi:hypothetical protein
MAWRRGIIAQTIKCKSRDVLLTKNIPHVLISASLFRQYFLSSLRRSFGCRQSITLIPDELSPVTKTLEESGHER